ncbi:DNA translocase FtsK [Amycolatopsis sp. QT-25]|uniref:DNA translocase FtsK n=1 Tax=Amycolatopsis sp. QT-25 TaxID=3034022 RepID=UPI0023EB1A68|nr:DNA translocase FtsK [Amycolatopsis sp. QT-25]WET79260.1 DNA translocase FtsK [Amycolatopsis sp. QT-25]
MSVSLSGRLPKDDKNGISMIGAALLDDPTSTHLVVAIVTTQKVTQDIESGEVIPTARIVACEAFPGSSADAKSLRRVWREAYEKRTGQQAIPFDKVETAPANAAGDLLRDGAGVVMSFPGAGKSKTAEEVDLICQAANLVITANLASVSMLARKLRVGRETAERLMDELRRRGVVGEAEGSKTPPVIPEAADLPAIVEAIRGPRTGEDQADNDATDPDQP